MSKKKRNKSCDILINPATGHIIDGHARWAIADEGEVLEVEYFELTNEKSEQRPEEMDAEETEQE